MVTTPLGDKKSEGSKRLEVSLDPTLINKQLKAKDLIKDRLITATVQAKEEHGYVVSFGVAGTTGFLPTQNTKDLLEKVHHSLTHPLHQQNPNTVHLR